MFEHKFFIGRNQAWLSLPDEVIWRLGIPLDFGRKRVYTQHYLFANLYEKAVKQHTAICSFWNWRSLSWKIALRGSLTWEETNQLEDLMHILSFVRPSRLSDVPIWKLNLSGGFSVDSFYSFLKNGGLRYPFQKIIWRSSIPEKIHIFLWLALRNKLHTGEVLVKKGWQGNIRCSFVWQQLWIFQPLIH